MIKALVVDDEQPARERLRRLLAEHAQLEVAGEAEDGEQAMEMIAEIRPEVVFLDIQMPGCSGMEVAASLSSPRPKIIFCTAFDEYAVEAFELHAVDYLLKPINRARLQQAIEKICASAPAGSDTSIDQAGRSAGHYPTRFLGKYQSRYRVVPRQEVLYFCSEGGLTRLESHDRHYWMQPSLSDLEKRLEPGSFFRVSRSVIVNLDAVRELLPMPGGHGKLELTNGARIDVSRRRFKPLMDLLAQP